MEHKELEKKPKKIMGMFWHCHHNSLCEYVYDYQERVDYIKENKPKREIKIRLRLFKKVKGNLPKEFVETSKKYNEARKKYNEAWNKLNKARKKYYEVGKKLMTRKKCDELDKKCDKAFEKCYEAFEKCDEVWNEYKPQIKKLHKKECGCKEWNSKKGKLVFRK